MVALLDPPTVPPRGNRIRLLGGFRLEIAGAPVTLPVNGQRLLAYLSLRGSVARTEAAGTLWPNADERNASGSLRTTIWRIHRCGVPVIQADGGRLAVAPSVAVDTQLLRRSAEDVLRRPDEVDPSWLPRLRQESELLPGWYDDWVIFERERFRQLLLHTMEAVAVRLTQCRAYGEAMDIALETIPLEPLRESAHRVVIGIHIAEGNLGEAVRHFRFVSGLLREELGVEPSAQLSGLVPAALRTR